MTSIKSIVVFLLLIAPFCLLAQADPASPLFKILKSKDSLLFDVGFNTCDLTQFENNISNKFEFYHDEAGITSSKAIFISGIRDKICKLNYKTANVQVKKYRENVAHRGNSYD